MQCTLPINIYIEKMYLITGIWCIILFFLSIYSFFDYLGFLTLSRKNFVEKRLNNLSENDKIKVENNLTNIRPDDLLVLKLIKDNTSDYEVTNIIRKLNKTATN
jgi:hypothetical protein